MAMRVNGTDTKVQGNGAYALHPWATPRNILFLVGSILGFAGILTSVIVDLALNRRITWSIFPLSAILYAWLSCAPLAFLKKGRAVIAMLIASALLFPLLYILSQNTGGWFHSPGVPCAVIGLALAWAMLLLWRSKLGLWNKLAISALLLAATDVGVDAVLFRTGINTYTPGPWEYFPPVGLALAAAALFIIGRLRKTGR